MPTQNRMEKYIEFVIVGTSDSGKTGIWEVRNKYHKTVIGEVRWYGAWRKYGFFSDGGVFEPACLRYIADFVEEKTKEHGLIVAAKKLSTEAP